VLSFGGSEEDDLAGFNVLWRVCRFDDHGMRADTFSGDNGLQDIEKCLI
jgi:hypothetical protein